jgi:Zn-dependent peptidase ImmA (M78 family)
MATYLRDSTGRFPQRPHYDPEELDHECETVIADFLLTLHGEIRYPIATDDLTKLIERDAEYLDIYADLSSYGANVEGLTEFNQGRKPCILISASLSKFDHMENRLRTTLTHEYGHVYFHNYLWQQKSSMQDLLSQHRDSGKEICKRDSMIDAPQKDWMEWQAGYACGAFLMPKTAVMQLVCNYVEEHGIYGTVSLQTPHAQNLSSRMTKTFQVSDEAARIRLLKIGLLTETAPNLSLFK